MTRSLPVLGALIIATVAPGAEPSKQPHSEIRPSDDTGRELLQKTIAARSAIPQATLDYTIIGQFVVGGEWRESLT